MGREGGRMLQGAGCRGINKGWYMVLLLLLRPNSGKTEGGDEVSTKGREIASRIVVVSAM